MRTWIGAVMVAAASLGAAQPGDGPRAMTVRTDPARLESVGQWREVTGELRALRRSVLAARQEGLVSEVTVDDGDAVKAGQVIARIDDVHTRLMVRADEAAVRAHAGAVAMRRADLERAQRDVQRYDLLDTKGSVSELERDIARTGVSLAQARLEQAEGELAAAEAMLARSRRRLEEMTIAAPFDARVVRKRTEIGQWLAVGDPVAEVVALDQLEARLDVPERIAVSVREGSDSARVRAASLGSEFAGVVRAVMPDVDPLSRLVAIRVVIENPDARLRPGMSVTGLIRTGEEARAVTVSKDAILRDDAGEFLYIDAGGTAAPVRVRSAFAVGDRVVVHGLSGGERVIVAGNERLFPGAPVAEPGASPPGAGGNAGK